MRSRYDGRSLIDPDNKYPSECPRSIEVTAETVLRILPGARLERTRDAIQIDTGDDEMALVLLITPEALELRLSSTKWTCGSNGPVAASVLWKRLPETEFSTEQLTKLIADAKDARRAQFRECRYCGQTWPPEHMDGDVCHGCEEREQGIVH